MLKSITYSVTFGTTGRTLAETIVFQKGFGTITGPNEAGKSFVIEMIRWCLFGSAALRGKAAELKKAKATLIFESRGETYTVTRTPTNAKLFRDQDEIAVGTTPVNEKIVGILGFGLAVFDMACVANQGEIEALVSMKPAERKRLVDSSIGLGVIDDMAKIAQEEGNALNRQANDLAATVTVPVQPEVPEGFLPLDVIDAELAALSEANNQLQQLRGWFQSKPQEPVAPVDPQLGTVEFLEGMASAQHELESQLRKAQNELQTLPTPSPYTRFQLDEMRSQWATYHRWAKKAALLRQYPDGCPLSVQELDAAEREIALWELTKQARQLKAAIEKLEGQGEHTCPACAHHWPVAVEAITPLRDELSIIEKDVRWDILKPELTMRDIEGQRRMIEEIDRIDKLLVEFNDVEKVDKPALDEAAIEQHEKRQGYEAQRATLEVNISTLQAALADQPDYAAQARQRRAYDDAYGRFLTASLTFADWQAQAEEKAAKVAALEKEVAKLPALQELKTKVVVHMTLMQRFEQDAKRYADLMVQVEELKTEAADWQKAREALTTLRGLVKQHLMPSLNKVASFYLVQMTGGQRQTVFADEDFNILVDGQELNTLSGSGKAVACLALRLGLGQVLTNNVLSLFVGDEIDASMDKERAENTAQTLQTLKGRISQILLVTHKFPAADYYISVGKQHDELFDAA